VTPAAAPAAGLTMQASSARMLPIKYGNILKIKGNFFGNRIRRALLVGSVKSIPGQTRTNA
jgi:hypothetical protein